MDDPLFYHFAKASGLIKPELLDDILKEIRSEESGLLKAQIDALLPPVSCQGDSVRRIPRLRPAIGSFISSNTNQQETVDKIDDAAATLDGEQARPGGSFMTELDHRLADELVRRGLLNHWQSVQLLEGRTKFTLGNYWIVEAIGKGGYGHVFLGCENTQPKRWMQRESGLPSKTERCVAIKVLPLSKATPDLTSRFLHEIEIQKNLNHRNIIQYIDSGRDGNVDYVVHEFADGGDLKRLLLREGPLPFEIAVAIISHISEAVQYLHEKSIVHRDIKPANILLFSEGIAKLTDMGLAAKYDRFAMLPHYVSPAEDPAIEKQAERIEKKGGKIAGTFDYMAPDQIQNPTKPSPPWDIYSLGCTFYRLLTGRVPFPGTSPKQKIYAQLNLSPVDLRVFNQTVPFDIVKLIREMMLKNPQHRIQTAWEVSERLKPWLPPIGWGEEILFQDYEEECEPPLQNFAQKPENNRPSNVNPTS